MNWIPLGLLVAFFSIGVVWRTWLQRRRHGHAGWFLFHGAPLRGVVGVFASLALAADAALGAAAPQLRAPLHPLPPLVAPGAAIVLGALFLMAWAQLDLGASWRVGIDPHARPGLVTGGAYARCRNPIFACCLLALAGFVLVLPDALTLALAIAGVMAIHRQVRDEERYLEATYGEAYRHYRARVPRYLPFAFDGDRAMLRAP